MIEANISQRTALAQQIQTVFCPMCEVWHENNSWCQAPAATMEGLS